MATDSEIADWLGTAILNTVPGYDAVKNRGEIGQLVQGVKEVTKSPIQAHVEQEQAKRAAGQLMAQHAAENLGLDPATGLPAAHPMPLPAAPAPAAEVAPAPESSNSIPLPPPAPSRAPAKMAPAAQEPNGPYAQSPSMLPGTDPEEIAAAKRAADKQAEDAKFAADEQEIKDAIAAGHNAAAQTGLQAFITNLASPNGELRKRQLAEANAPLQELLQRREALSKLRTERGQQEEQARQRSLNAPDSELTKTSAVALRALGVPVPKGYTASMFEQMKGIAELTGKQKHEAAAEIVAQQQANEAARHNRASESADRARIASEHEARLLAAGAPEKAMQVAKLQQVEAYNKAQQVGEELKKIAEGGRLSLLDPEVRGRAAQLRHELATLAVQAKSKPGVVPRPNAVEEELHLLPPIGAPQGLLQGAGTQKNLVDSFVKGIGGEAGVPEAAPAGGGWDAAKEARLQELRRKAGK